VPSAATVKARIVIPITGSPFRNARNPPRRLRLPDGVQQGQTQAPTLGEFPRIVARRSRVKSGDIGSPALNAGRPQRGVWSWH
jgi:hypothetical protein